MTDTRTKEILIQVSFKAQIEREKNNKRLTKEEFEKEVWNDYIALERLIERAINPCVGKGELDNAQKWIDSSTFDTDQRAELESFLNDNLKWEDYWKLLSKVKANQLDGVDIPSASQTNFNEGLKAKGK